MEISVNLDEFIADTNQLLIKFTEHIPKVLQATALDSFDIIRNRIQETGKDFDGSQLPPYSEIYHEKKAERYGEESASFRNLTATGDMWRNIGITSTEQTDEGLVVTVEGETQFAKNKINWNGEKIGDFLRLSTSETEVISEGFQTEIDSFFNANQ